MKTTMKSALAATALIISAQAAADVTFYERENFRGQSFTTDRSVGNLERFGFSDRASSAVVRGDRYEVCDDVRFGGRCMILRPGNYPSLAAMGMNNRISSIRDIERGARFEDNRYAPAPVAVYERPRADRLYEANVTSVRAVMAANEQRCWVDREQVTTERSRVPGAVIGGVIGGVLGHQIGRGTGNDVATVGGVVGGAAVGANVGRDRETRSQDVQRCENVPGNARTDYWDVDYTFRGQSHRAQLSNPPGATITVDEAGEPRL